MKKFLRWFSGAPEPTSPPPPPAAPEAPTPNRMLPTKAVELPLWLNAITPETTEFGRQVSMMISADWKNVSVDPDLKAFDHPKLGRFAVSTDGEVVHRGEHYNAGAMRQPNTLRVLTSGDSALIVEALRFGLSTALPLTEPEPEKQAAPALNNPVTMNQMLQQQQQAMNQMRQQLLQYNGLNHGLLNHVTVDKTMDDYLRKSVTQAVQEKPTVNTKELEDYLSLSKPSHN